VAGPSDEIWVARGTYLESIFLEPTVSLYGGFPASGSPEWEARDWEANETIIDATGLETHTVVGADDATLDGFTVTEGTAEDGGGVYCNNSSPALANCSITGNSAGENGGGMYCNSDSSPKLTNCTIQGNSAEREGGGLFNNSQFVSPTVINCILWDDSPEEIHYGSRKPRVTYSCIQRGWSGEGNIDEDPLFRMGWGSDVYLGTGSPCVDAGNPDPAYNDGCLPPGQGTVRNDIGAYGGPGNCGWMEYEPSPTPTPTVTPTPSPTSTSTPTFTATHTATPTERTGAGCDSGYYVLDSFGGRHRVGNPYLITGPVYFGEPVARDMERAVCEPAGSATPDLVVLDGYGGAHFVSSSDCDFRQGFYFGDISKNEFPEGRAIDLEMSSDSLGFWVLTDYGGIYRAGSAKEPSEDALVPNTDRSGVLGFDVSFGEMRDPELTETRGASLRAVSMVVIDMDRDSRAEGYVILDSQGGRFHLQPDGTSFTGGSFAGFPDNHPFRLLDPEGYVWPFFAGLDIARDAEIHTTMEGLVVLDGWDGIHPVPVDIESNAVYFANNRVSNADDTPLQTVGLP
jgi:parallel beta-helix repeat protein